MSSPFCCPLHSYYLAGSFAVRSGDHLRSAVGIICGSGIICGPIWGSFAVGDHLRSRDHLRRCDLFWYIWVCLLVGFRDVLVYKCRVVLWFSLVVVGCFVCFNEDMLFFSNFFKIGAELFLEVIRVVVGFKINSLYHVSHTVLKFV